MRVINTAVSRNYGRKMNQIQERLNKSMNKINGKEYETAAESPLTYYKGKAIDTQYQELLAKSKLTTDVRSRLYQQEQGIYDIQNLLSAAKNEIVLRARTDTTPDTALMTLRDDLLQKEHNMVNDLLAQYQDFYVYGGNDASTPPFALSADGMTLTFSHVFPGEDKNNPTNFVMEFDETATPPGFKLEDAATKGELFLKAMKEQGYMDLGYGDIRDRATLLDTYTGGMNVLTGITSEQLRADASIDVDQIMKGLTEGPLGMAAQAIHSLNTYLKNPGATDARKTMSEKMGKLIDEMTNAEHKVSTFYSDLGNKYNTLEKLEPQQKKMMDYLTEQYKDIVGADPYEAIYEMYNNQYAYNAALQVGSKIMGSSLFDFIS